jgi:hypothetical protein
MAGQAISEDPGQPFFCGYADEIPVWGDMKLITLARL